MKTKPKITKKNTGSCMFVIAEANNICINPTHTHELFVEPDSYSTASDYKKWKKWNLKPSFKETDKDCSYLLAGVVLVLATLLVINYKL